MFPEPYMARANKNLKMLSINGTHSHPQVCVYVYIFITSIATHNSTQDTGLHCNAFSGVYNFATIGMRHSIKCIYTTSINNIACIYFFHIKITFAYLLDFSSQGLKKQTCLFFKPIIISPA